MIERRPLKTLGEFRGDWLLARYHFSFAGYHDSERMGVGPLRVWNDDHIAPGKGFDMHGHHDMEIITYVRAGAIWHRDHLGNEGLTEAGNVQVMSAGKGILHAEYNRGETPTMLYQIWIEPIQKGGPPRWETRVFPDRTRAAELVPLASGQQGVKGALPINQDATVFGALLPVGASLEHDLSAGRRAYLVAPRGRLIINGTTLEAGDGLVVADQPSLYIASDTDSELVLADLP